MAEPCDEKYEGCTSLWKKIFGFAWKRGAPLGFTTQEFLVLPSWSPRVWNSVCVSASASLGLFRVNINDCEIRFRAEQYDGFHTKHEANIALMGRYDSEYSVRKVGGGVSEGFFIFFYRIPKTSKQSKSQLNFCLLYVIDARSRDGCEHLR